MIDFVHNEAITFNEAEHVFAGVKANHGML